MSGETRTQGTELFFGDTFNSPQAIKKVINVVDVGEFGPQADDIESTNLDSTAKEYFVGLPDNGEATIQLNMKFTDPVLQLLEGRAGTETQFTFCVAYADGTNAPTLTGNTLTPPTQRSSDKFLASVKSFRKGVKKNDLVRVTMALRISGGITHTYHA